MVFAAGGINASAVFAVITGDVEPGFPASYVPLKAPRSRHDAALNALRGKVPRLRSPAADMTAE